MSSRKYLIETDKIINEAFSNHFLENSALPTRLVKQLQYSFSDIGFRFRSSLFRIGCELQSINYKRYINISLGIELLQTSTLVLDDIIDNATKRNGEIVLHLKSGIPSSIITAEILQQYFVQFILSNKYLNSEQKVRLIYLINDSLKSIYIGQYIDLNSQKYVHDVNDYFDMISQTTAKFICNSLIAGYALGDQSNHQKALNEYGLNIGKAYQVRDDITDFIATSGIGKDICLDIKQGRRRLPILLLRQNIKGNNKVVNRVWDGIHNLSDSDVEYIVEMLFDYKIDLECQNILNKLCDNAAQSINCLSNKKQYKLLLDFIEIIRKL